MAGKYRKRMEFSKKIIAVLLFLEAFVVISCCVVAFRIGDIEIFKVLVPSVFASTATGIGFYFNKAKLENKIKLMKSADVKITKKDFE